MRQWLLSYKLWTANGWRPYFNRAQLNSLEEKLDFLLDFLKKYSFNDSELEARIRYAAYDVEDVIASEISNQLLAEMEFAEFSIFEELFELFQKVKALIQIWIALMCNIIPISVISLLTVCFLNVIFFILLSFFVIMTIDKITDEAQRVVHIAVLKGRSFAVRCWQCFSQPENQDLGQVMDAISLIMEEVIKIKDASEVFILQGSSDICLYESSRERKDACGSGVLRREFGGRRKNVYSVFDEINARLIGHSSNLELEIVSIVGMGGIGKTTLARRVYEGPHVDHHFDIRAWVTFSQEYSLYDVTRGLLDSAKICTKQILQNHKEGDGDLDQKLGELLHRNLVGRRYLIVMDDVWDRNILDSVRRFFPESYKGSRVLLTTRGSDLASYANPANPPFQMQVLNDDDSWHLLCEKIFGGESCPPELEVIGRAIARSCRGLPLAIVVVGGLLCNAYKTWPDWSHVSRNLNSILSEFDGQCLEILGLSYDHLPHHLKPCFLYMAVFPGSTEISVTRLFNLWAAEGFLEGSTSKSMEEVAEEYLYDLIERSLIMVGKLSCSGKIKTCKIHDLLRSVCLLKADKENFDDFAIPDREIGHGGNEIGRSTQFLDLASAREDSISSYSMARSIIYVGETFHDLSQIYLGFRLLRVLDVVAAKLFVFPDVILQLVLLRYLGLSLRSLQLPPSISRLRKLQTIVFHYAVSRGIRIPVEIWSIQNLRHLYFGRGLLPEPLPITFLRSSTILQNLQTLVGILDFQCTKGILRSVPNLKKLGICYDDSGGIDWSECQLESLVNLQQLEALKITVEYQEFIASVPELAFPQKLRKLTLSGCRLPWASMRMIGALPNLEVLKLRYEACSGPSWETDGGEFPELRFLLLEQLSFTCWETDATSFPCLERLAIRSCGMLQEIPCAIGEIPTLEMIELVNCIPSAVSSAKEIQDEQKKMGNDDLKVLIIGRHAIE